MTATSQLVRLPLLSMPSSRQDLKRAIYRTATGKRSEHLDITSGGTGIPLTLAELVWYLCSTGLVPLLRGTIFRARVRRSEGPLFLGRGTRVLYPRLLQTGRHVSIGDGVYLNCLARDGVKLGHRVRLREFVWSQATSVLTDPGAGLSIGDGTYVGPHCVLGAGGGIRIGRDVTIGAYVHLLAENHKFDDLERPINEQGVERKGIVVEDNCWIGNGAMVLDGVHVGSGAVIAAGAIVTRDVPSDVVVAGNPARVLRRRGSRGESDRT